MSDYAPSSVIDFKFSTSLDGVPTTLAGTPAVSIYKDNSTTQTTTGVTLTVDFDGLTGLHNVRVDTSDSFYASGSSFQIIVTTGTVGGNSIVGHVVDSFTIDRGNVASLKANTITAAAIATDAIDADALKADAVTEIQSGLSTATNLAAVQTVVDAVQAKTDNLPADPADESLIIAATDQIRTDIAALPTPPTATENADALLKRDWTSVTGEAARSVMNALRFLRNKWSMSGTTLTVTKEDDTAAAWTAEVTTNASADPITGSDPA